MQERCSPTTRVERRENKGENAAAAAVPCRNPPHPPTHPPSPPTPKKRAFFLKNNLPIQFMVAFVLAMAWPWLGAQVLAPQVAGVHVVTFLNIVAVFFISGLTLRTDELKDAFDRRGALGTAFGLLSILGLTPLLGFGVAKLPLEPAAFVTGLTIFTIVPTTLGVGVSLVTSASGNVALAIFLTVATNVAGVVLIPLWLRAMFVNGAPGVESAFFFLFASASPRHFLQTRAHTTQTHMTQNTHT